MTAGISIHYLDAVPLLIFGRSDTTSIEETLDRLGGSEFSSLAIVASGNYFYVVSLIRHMSELDSYTEFVKRAAEMPSPTVGIYGLDYPDYSLAVHSGKRKQSYKELSPVDLKIIASLKDDARRPTADIAEMVGVSAKTVRRHLEDMISDGSLEFYVPFDPGSGEDLFFMIHVNLRDGADKVEVGRRLLSKYPSRILFVRTFRNIPSFLMCILCSDKTTEIRKVIKGVGEDEDVLTAMPNFVYLRRHYVTWRDKLPGVRTSSSRVARVHDLHSRPRRQYPQE